MTEEKQHEQKQEQHIEVAVVTTSGSFPAEGFDTVPIHQKVRVQLKKAVDKFGITDTSNWIAVVGERELNVELSYLENDLHSQVEIDYGPREGGGGCE